jgi:hypothetical protein
MKDRRSFGNDVSRIDFFATAFRDEGGITFVPEQERLIRVGVASA